VPNGVRWVLVLLLGGLVFIVARERRDRGETWLRAEAQERIGIWVEAHESTRASTRSVWPPVERLGRTMERVLDQDFDPSKQMSEACTELNRSVVSHMRALQLAGAPPPFPVDPLMEVLRTGRCGPGDPSVRVLRVWLGVAAEQAGLTLPGLTPRSSGRSP